MSFELLSERLENLGEDVSEIKQSMAKVSEAVVALARIEERQAQTSQAMDRAFDAIAKLEIRMLNLEKTNSDARRVANWIDRAVIGIVLVVGLYVFRHVGVL